MPSPKKKKSAKTKLADPKPATPKSKIASLLSLVPHHPLWAELNDPENEGRVWLVEFVRPPGLFMARSVPEPVDAAAIQDEVSASFKALFTGSPEKTRYTLGMGYSGGHARRLVEGITEAIPNPAIPFTHAQLHEIEMTFRVVQ